jgi:integrase
MTTLKYLRVKKAKGRVYYYADVGKREDGQRDLRPLPGIKDPRFGDCYARAMAVRTQKKNRQGVLTLDGLIRQYEKSPEFRGLRGSSQYNYSLYLARANSLMRSVKGESPPLSLIDRAKVLALRDRLSGTPGAANSAIGVVAALFAWAVENGKLEKNPAANIKKFKAKPHEPWPETLLEEALADPQVGMPVALLYFTGQRIDDVIRMSWGDIKGDHMLVHVKKKDKQIRVAILPELASRLSAQSKDAVTILTNSNGNPWAKGGLRVKLQTWAKERGHKVVPHGLRKNAVNSLLEAGCTMAEVSGITDQSMVIIEHYARDRNALALGRAAIIKLDAHRRKG